MKSAIVLATLALAFGAPLTTQDLSKRDDSMVTIPQALEAAATNAKQTAETLVEQLKRGDGHAGADTVDALITGLDSQVDNLADFITKDLNGVTLGVSGAIGDFLLGPIFQSLTNGAEVIISNVIGGSVDMVTDGAVKALTNTMASLHSLGQQIKMPESTLSKLDTAQKQLEHVNGADKDVKHHKAATGKRATDADLSGVNGSMTNYRQVQDTLNSQLKSHNGHAAQATINAFITGADSQIDNAVATVSNALAPYTLGVSKAIGDVLLGPFVQSVTNGAEVLVSNLLGGSIDGVADVAMQAYAESLNNLVQLADKYGVNEQTKNALSHAQQRVATILPLGN